MDYRDLEFIKKANLFIIIIFLKEYLNKMQGVFKYNKWMQGKNVLCVVPNSYVLECRGTQRILHPASPIESLLCALYLTLIPRQVMYKASAVVSPPFCQERTFDLVLATSSPFLPAQFNPLTVGQRGRLNL